MFSGHVMELRQVYKHLLQDAAYTFPELAEEFEKDSLQLEHHAETRGFPLFAVDLPAVGKHLDRCLQTGQFAQLGIPLTKRVSKKIQYPKLFRGLYSLVFGTDGCLRDEPSTDAIFFLRQLYYTAKKVEVSYDDDKLRKEVVSFIETDASLPRVDTPWDTSAGFCTRDSFDIYKGLQFCPAYLERLYDLFPTVCEGMESFARNFDRISDLVASTLGSYDYKDWSFRHGPGAVSDRRRFTNKYSWVQWSERLEAEFPIADCGFHSYAAWAHSQDGEDGEVISDAEGFSKLIAVPKTFSGPRLIAAEPTANQWCQQNIWDYFSSRSAATFIGDFVRFRDQTLNQTLCLEGSRCGHLVTVDLSSASDRVTPWLVGQMFRSNPKLLCSLSASRTRYVEVNFSSVSLNIDEYVKLRKFSTMGSACTFPVQSLIFLTIALASIASARKLKPSKENILALRGEVTVFGDDIIIPKDASEILFTALEVLYFKVNTTKTCTEGNFRESCGVDAYAGVDVTPVYWQRLVDRSPESIASTISVVNNFRKKFLNCTASHVASTIRQVIPEVRVGSGIVGFETRTRILRNPAFKRRFNKNLHREEILIPVFLTRVKKTPISDDSALLQFFTEKPDPTVMWRSGTAQNPALKYRCRWVSVDEL